MLDTLHYLVKGGRAPKAAEIATSLLQIKPIIGVIDGVAKPIENCLTASKAMQRMVQMVAEQTPFQFAPTYRRHACRGYGTRSKVIQFDSKEVPSG